MGIINTVADNVEHNPKKQAQLKTFVFSAGAFAALAVGAWGYNKLAEPVGNAFSNARDAATARLEQMTEDAYAPHIEQAKEETVGYITRKPVSGEGIYSLIGQAWDVDSENERGAMLRYFRDLNGLENSTIQPGVEYLVPVDAAHALQHGLNND